MDAFLRDLFPRRVLRDAKRAGGLAKVREERARLANLEAKQVKAPFRVDKARMPSIVSPPGWYQCDIVFLPAYASRNRGVGAFLLLVSIRSRKAFAYPLRNTRMPTILAEYGQFLTDAGDVKGIQADNQFAQQAFVNFNASRGVSVATDVAALEHWVDRPGGGLGDKLGVVDRLVETLRSVIREYMRRTKNLRWTGYLQAIVREYNASPHRSLSGRDGKRVVERSPDEVDGDEAAQEELMASKVARNARILRRAKFKPGQTVRILKKHGTFDKGPIEFSRALYTVDRYDGFRVRVRNSHGVLRRRLREHELQLVDKSGLVRLPSQAKKQAADKAHRAALRAARSGILTYREAQTVASRAAPKTARARQPTARMLEATAAAPPPRKKRGTGVSKPKKAKDPLLGRRLVAPPWVFPDTDTPTPHPGEVVKVLKRTLDVHFDGERKNKLYAFDRNLVETWFV